MNPLFVYLFKSSVWLLCFAATYMLFLRNERYFLLNRIFLVVGVLISLLAPIFTIYYKVTVPIPVVSSTAELPTMHAVVDTSGGGISIVAWLFYIGVVIMLSRLIVQTVKIAFVIKHSKVESVNGLKVIYSNKFSGSFTFLSYVFINPSVINPELREVLNHETEHVVQYHFVDLFLAEILRIILWFNPIAWFYGGYIRQNHEFLADKKALMRSAGLGVYKAVLLNAVAGGEVVRLGHHLNYSLNKKRFKMMTNKPTSKRSFLKPLLVLPMAAIVMYSFAKPVYEYDTQADAVQSEPVAQTPVVKKDEDKKNPIYILNGKEITFDEMKAIDTNTISELKVLKGEKADELYGEKAKNGVIEVKLKDGSEPEYLKASGESGKIIEIKAKDVDSDEVFFKVEEMPQFPGGDDALRTYISDNVKYPDDAVAEKIEGRVFVSFVVDKNGDVTDVKVLRGVHPRLDEESLRVVREMPKWTPGTLKGKPVGVSYTIPVSFKLN